MTANQVYKVIEKECRGLDAIYEDYIVSLVGYEGLDILKEERLVELSTDANCMCCVS